MNYIKHTFLGSLLIILSIGNTLEGHAVIKTASDAQYQIRIQQELAQTELNKSKLIQIKIDKLNDEYNNNSKIVEEQAREAQVNQQSGETSLIGMLANSKNLGDFLRMSNSVSILNKSQQIHLDSQKVLLKNLKSQEEKAKVTYIAANNAMNEAIKEYQTLSTKEQQEFLSRQKLKDYDNVLSSSRLSKVGADSKYSSSTEAQKFSRTLESSKIENILNVADQYIGVPYVWGGTTPSGWDCSGFISFVYRKALGIEIGRTTFDQMASGHSIPYDQAQPGDLLIFDGGTHVGIYIGNNTMINAENPKVGTKIQDLTYWQPDYALTY